MWLPYPDMSTDRQTDRRTIAEKDRLIAILSSLYTARKVNQRRSEPRAIDTITNVCMFDVMQLVEGT